jgi:nucleoside-diphosphate-sugar epimerase
MGVKKTKVIIYGGNGFVGTHVAKRLSLANAKVVAVSRKGNFPKHLHEEDWAKRVSWKKGDANQPDMELLATCDVMVCLVGSPPIPTFNADAYEQQLFMNGTANVSAIEAAGKAGIKRLVLLGAKIPESIQGDRFAYAKGKRLSLEAALKFSELSKEHQATILQPGGIYGTRHTAGGMPIPINWVLAPLAKIIPSQLVSVDRVADRIADAALCANSDTVAFSVIANSHI